MDEIEKIASKVLGKTTDGKTMMRYETPEQIDSSLLVGVPRYLNRTQYGISEDNLPFVGIDAWNGYEFSCLLDNGFPLSGWIKWVYRADTLNIVESKSAKLYLNSYNMCKMGKTVAEATQAVIDLVSADMAEVIGGEVQVSLHTNEYSGYQQPLDGMWFKLEEYVDVENISFDQYNENPNTLKIVPNAGLKRFSSSSLRSNCRVTNQPDWGDIFIHIKSDLAPTPESLLQYIVSMRKENHFHEEICECVYKRLWDLTKPVELLVGCLYTRRGGIDINPIRASSEELLNINPICSLNITAKTMRQ